MLQNQEVCSVSFVSQYRNLTIYTGHIDFWMNTMNCWDCSYLNCEVSYMHGLPDRSVHWGYGCFGVVFWLLFQLHKTCQSDVQSKEYIITWYKFQACCNAGYRISRQDQIFRIIPHEPGLRPFLGGTSFVDHLCFFCVLYFSCFRVCPLLPCGHLLGKG